MSAFARSWSSSAVPAQPFPYERELETFRLPNMRSVVELPPEPHTNLRTYRGYRLEVRDCFHCGRDLHVYVPAAALLGFITTGVPCPHCHQWEAETLIPLESLPIYVSACQRTWLQWQTRRALRWLGIACARGRIWVRWPYWAIYRLKGRWSSRHNE